MFGLGPPELIVLLLIVVILFGAGRIGRLAGELGQGIRDFRRGLGEQPAEPPSEANPDRPDR